MKIDVICPLYNGRDYIEKIYNQVMMQENVVINELKFILTDTNDGSEEILNELKVPENRLPAQQYLDPAFA